MKPLNRGRFFPGRMVNLVEIEGIDSKEIDYLQSR